VRFNVLTAANMNEVTVFWDFALCNLMESDRRFRCAYCDEHPDDEGSKHF
jgi:hypothetical protein